MFYATSEMCSVGSVTPRASVLEGKLEQDCICVRTEAQAAPGVIFRMFEVGRLRDLPAVYLVVLVATQPAAGRRGIVPPE